jgi:hypothetical protein
MRNLLLLVLVLACAGIGGYYYAYDRLPWEEASPEDQQISALKDDFTRIRQQWAQAGRTQGLGVDAGSQTEGVMARLDKLDRDLEELSPRVKGTQAKVKLSNLRTEIAAFKMSMR